MTAHSILRVTALAAIAVSLLTGVGCEPSQSAQVVTTQTRTGPVREVSLSIEGMTCQSCVNSITTTVSKIDGVREVNVDLENGRATIKAVESVPETEITSAIEKLGFTASTTTGGSTAENKPG